MKNIFIWLSVVLIFGTVIYPRSQSSIDNIILDTAAKKDYITPIYHIFGINLIINRFDYHVSGLAWADVNPSTWWININRGFMTDGDAFATNWFGHPYHGSLAFNAARMQNLAFYESTSYVVGHSLLWEYFAETEPPSIIDFYTTTFGGIYLGEITYRLTDFSWNHPSKFKNPIFRKVIGGLINPVAAINRWVLGKNLSVTANSFTPLKFSLKTGLNYRFDPTQGNTSAAGQRIGFDLSYGNIYDRTKIKYNAFDHFRFNSWLWNINHFKSGSRNTYFNIQSDAIILGKKYSLASNTSLLAGMSQHYDFLQNDRYKLSIIGLTGDGALLMTSEVSDVHLAAKLGLIIYGSSNSDFVVPVHIDIFPRFNRDYIYGHGLMLEAESLFDFKKNGLLEFILNFYRINSKDNPTGVKNITLIKSKYNIPIYQNINAGFQYDHYHSKADFKNAGETFNQSESFHDLSLLLVFYF
ncbi:MAG: DUF3943 domain-containing protein [Saprospiraceae bacterium]|jgi:hypothetical protein|nr:DUF3943 domain-containing protein [Saprospiraceae bacterium]